MLGYFELIRHATFLQLLGYFELIRHATLLQVLGYFELICHDTFMSAGSAISFFGFNIIYLYECLSLVIVSCSMQVKVRCKVVWQVVPNSSIHNMLKSRSVARSSGRLCQLHQYIINMWNYKKMRFRLGEILVFSFHAPE